MKILYKKKNSDSLKRQILNKSVIGIECLKVKYNYYILKILKIHNYLINLKKKGLFWWIIWSGESRELVIVFFITLKQSPSIKWEREDDSDSFEVDPACVGFVTQN